MIFSPLKVKGRIVKSSALIPAISSLNRSQLLFKIVEMETEDLDSQADTINIGLSIKNSLSSVVYRERVLLELINLRAFVLFRLGL